MIGSGPVMTVLIAWLATYAVHSTLLLVAALLAVRLLGRRQLALQEALLRTALLGGLLTAILQLVAGITPLSGSLLSRTSHETTPASTAPLLQPSLAAENELKVLPLQSASLHAATEPITAEQGAAEHWRIPWPEALLLLWLAGSVLTAGRLLSSWRRLRQLLAASRPMPSGRLLRRLAARIGVRRSVRVSICEAISSPFATGLRRPEICLPAGAVSGISAEQCTALLAHELAHLARRDPAWQLVNRVIRGVFFFQPLNWLATVKLEATAECLCDDLAVARTGNRVGLAQCLVHFADGFSPGRPVPIAAAVPRTSNLTQRVERILRGETSGSISMRALSTLVVLVLAVATITLPSVLCPSPSTAEAAVAMSSGTPPFPSPLDIPAEQPRAEPAAPAAPALVAEPAPVASPAPMPAPQPVADPAAPAEPKPAAVPEPPVAPESVLDEEEVGRLVSQAVAKAERIARLEDELKDLQLSEEEIQRIEKQMQELEQSLGQDLEKELQQHFSKHMAEIEDMARRQAELLLADNEKYREITERARELAEQLRPSMAELKKLQEEAQRMARQLSTKEMKELQLRAQELQTEAQHTAKELQQRIMRELNQRNRAESRARSEELRLRQEEARAERAERRRAEEEARQRAREEERERARAKERERTKSEDHD